MDSPESAAAGPDSFANGQISVEGLPQLDDHPFEPLDPAYVRMRTTLATFAAAGIAAATVVIAVATRSIAVTIAGLVALCLVGVVGALHRVEAAHMGYLARDLDLSFRSGVIGRSVATVPFGRVQHVSIERGPVNRHYGLASLQLRTAGGAITIPGLSVDLADRLKELVAGRAGELAAADAG